MERPNHLPPLPKKNRLGLDPTNPSKGDAAFYDWIAGEDQEASLAEFVKWFIDDLKEETDERKVRELIEDWRARCRAEDFQQRLLILGKLLPANHPFHHVKRLYSAEE